MKGTAVKVINQKGGFRGSLMKVSLPLIKVCLPLMENLLRQLGLKCLKAIRINFRSISNRCSSSKNSYMGDKYTDNLKQRNVRYHENNNLLKKDGQ